MRTLRLALICAITFLFAAKSIASITLTSQLAEIKANDASSNTFDVKIDTGTTVPSTTNVDAIAGNSFSKNFFDWYTISGVTTFSFDLNHKRDGAVGSFAWTHEEHFVFTADCTQPYVLSGYYNVSNVGASDTGNAYMASLFTDTTASTVLLDNSQYSTNTTNETFTLGGVGGDSFNGMTGSLTGTLIAGHNYLWQFLIYDEAPPGSDFGATALGNITLIVGPCEDDVGEVPEPGSLIVWCGLLLAALSRSISSCTLAADRC